MTQTIENILPRWDDLSYEQEMILTLPLNKNYLVEGAPNTGKTILALFRAYRISLSGENVVFLVPTRQLMKYLKNLTGNSGLSKNIEVTTYDLWLLKIYGKDTRRIPSLSNNNNSVYSYDWNQIKKDFNETSTKISHFIIDDAQEFPIGFIEALTIVAKSITCFADPNQAIESEKTDIIDLLRKIVVEYPINITRNYYNSYGIARLSEVFWCGNYNLMPVTDERSIVGDIPHLIRCHDNDDQMKKITRIIRCNRELSIGVIASLRYVRNVYQKLSDDLGDEIEIELCNSLNKSKDFSKRGVKILSYRAMKNLWFDMVILIRFDAVDHNSDYRGESFDEIKDLRIAYTAITRASSRLYITYFSEQPDTKYANFIPIILNHPELIVRE